MLCSLTADLVRRAELTVSETKNGAKQAKHLTFPVSFFCSLHPEWFQDEVRFWGRFTDKYQFKDQVI